MIRPFQLRKDYNIRTNTYVVSYWYCGIDTTHLFNHGFYKLANAKKFVTLLERTCRASNIHIRFMDAKARKDYAKRFEREMARIEAKETNQKAKQS